MPPSDSQLERQEAIREAVEQLLDLILSDQEIAIKPWQSRIFWLQSRLSSSSTPAFTQTILFVC
jgi:hypothetical protein